MTFDIEGWLNLFRASSREDRRVLVLAVHESVKRGSKAFKDLKQDWSAIEDLLVFTALTMTSDKDAETQTELRTQFVTQAVAVLGKQFEPVTDEEHQQFEACMKRALERVSAGGS